MKRELIGFGTQNHQSYTESKSDDAHHNGGESLSTRTDESSSEGTVKIRVTSHEYLY